MISQESLEKFTRKLQTTQDNINREYCQHLFLSYLYRKEGAEKILFKGGTALRIIYGSPRFSEDLDFSGVKIRMIEIESILATVLADIEREGIKIEMEEVKHTIGGYLCIVYFNFLNYRIKIKIEISLRLKLIKKGVVTLITDDYIPAYNLIHLSQEEIVKGKIHALFERSKPRDFYDLYFLLRKGLIPVEQRKILSKILSKLKDQKINFRKELSWILPQSHHLILKGFKEKLEEEIRKFL